MHVSGRPGPGHGGGKLQGSDNEDVELLAVEGVVLACWCSLAISHGSELAASARSCAAACDAAGEGAASWARYAKPPCLTNLGLSGLASNSSVSSNAAMRFSLTTAPRDPFMH